MRRKTVTHCDQAYKNGTLKSQLGGFAISSCIRINHFSIQLVEFLISEMIPRNI